MAIDTFTWRTQGTPEGSFLHRVRVAQFGDGYKQVAGDGINPESQSWPLTFQGTEKNMLPLLTFIRQHCTQSCLWTPPYGVLGLYRVAADSIRVTPLGGNTLSISFTFEQTFQP
ncbi:phage tail protein [Candidatus Fukatsuia endosymbiont of Tuberolachnus salignus]|uniref:phage tail protein n=1 Tax=Candidatus Fukatsuia endosymbiont of Tuberolachnus salignus TaxID=3077957 RepID=UPI00313A77A8